MRLRAQRAQAAGRGLTPRLLCLCCRRLLAAQPTARIVVIAPTLSLVQQHASTFEKADGFRLATNGPGGPMNVCVSQHLRCRCMRPPALMHWCMTLCVA